MSDLEKKGGPQGCEILDHLYAVIEERRGTDPSESWTAKLLEKGLPKICQKLGEEATETVVAALAEGHQDLVEESADLLYHLLVLLQSRDLQLADVVAELESRHR